MPTKSQEPEGGDSGGEPAGVTAHSAHWLEIGVIALIGALVVGGYTLGSLNRDAFFLMKFEINQLPYMLIAVALVSIPFLSLYGKVSGLFPTGTLATAYFFLVGIGYLFMSRLVLIDTKWTVLAFYFFVTLAGVLSISIFWLAVGSRFFMRQAKKLMGLFGAGCVFGNLLGGSIGRWGSDFANTEGFNLISIAGQMFFLATALSLWVFRPSQMTAPQEKENRPGFTQGLHELSKTPLLRNIALMLMLGVMIGTLADYQLQDIAKKNFPSKIELVKFFGALYTILGAVTLVAQLAITRLVLKKLGMLGGLMSLPIAALPGAIAMVFFPGIASALLLRGAENGIRFSTYSSGYELSFLPLDEAKRKIAKPLIDVLLKRGATGIAALLILLLTDVIQVDRMGVSVATVVLVFALLVSVLRVRKAYVTTLQENLSKTSEDPFEKNLQTMVMASPQDSFHDEQTGAWSTSVLFAPELQAQLRNTAEGLSLSGPEKPIPVAAVPAFLDEGKLFHNLLNKKELRETLKQVYERGDVRLAAALIPILVIPEYKLMAEKIFSKFGSTAVGVLSDTALNDKIDMQVRRAAFQRLGKIDSNLSMMVLKGVLSSEEKLLRRTASSAFLSLRKLDNSKKLEIDELVGLLKRESVDDQVIWQAQAELRQSEKGGESSVRLQEELQQSQDRRLRHLFRLLSLCFDLRALQASFGALASNQPEAQDNALEYLDNILPEKVKTLVWPMIDTDAKYGKKKKARRTEDVVRDLVDAGATAIVQVPIFSSTEGLSEEEIFQSSKDTPES